MIDPPAGRETLRRVDELAPRGAQVFGDAPALVEAGRTLDYNQLADAVTAAAALLVQLGVRPGDRTLIGRASCRERVLYRV